MALVVRFALEWTMIFLNCTKQNSVIYVICMGYQLARGFFDHLCHAVRANGLTELNPFQHSKGGSHGATKVQESFSVTPATFASAIILR